MTDICIVNGQGIIPPSRVACERQGGVAVSIPSLPARSSADLISSDVPNPLWRSVIEAYVAAASSGQNLLGATQRLENLAVSLFEPALVVDRPTPNALRNWRSFARLLDLQPIENLTINLLLRLSQPQMTGTDRLLLYAYYNCRPETARQIEAQVRQRFLTAYRQVTEEFTGWQSADYMSPVGAFLRVAWGFVGNLFRFGSWNVGTIMPAMSSLNRQQVRRLLHMTESDFRQQITLANEDYEFFPVGSASKIRYFRILQDIKFIEELRSLASGNSPITQVIQQQLSGLTAEEARVFEEISRAGASFINTDNVALRESYGNFVNTNFRAYFQAPLNSPSRQGLAHVLGALYNLAPRFGFSRRFINVLFEITSSENRVDLAGFGRIASLAGLAAQRPTVTVAPQGLPAEIRTILETTGYANLVDANLREIIFTPEITGTFDAAVRDFGGDAFPVVRMVRVEYFDPEGRLLPAWQIAHALVHEAAHVAWAREVLEEQLLRRTPDERHAYLEGADFLERYLIARLHSGAINRHSEEMSEVMKFFIDDRLAGLAANGLLGYAEDNIEADCRLLPSREFLVSHGLAVAAELNLDVYPTNQARIFVEDQATTRESYDDLYDQMVTYLMMSLLGR